MSSNYIYSFYFTIILDDYNFILWLFIFLRNNDFFFTFKKYEFERL